MFLVRVTPSVDAMVKGAALLISSWPRGALAALDKRPGRETGVAVHVAEDPLRCVAMGGERYLEELARLSSTLSSGWQRQIGPGTIAERGIPAAWGMDRPYHSQKPQDHSPSPTFHPSGGGVPLRLVVANLRRSA